MKILIYAGSNCVGFHAQSLKERALGGTETGVIRLAEQLESFGHEVHVFTRLENPPPSHPPYHPLQAINQFTEADILISVRDWIPLFFEVRAKHRFFWSGDSYDQFSSYGMGDRRVSQQIDRFLSVSQWQADELCKRSGFPKDKVFVLGNGIHEPFFQKRREKKRKQLIYSSTPYRGLTFTIAYYQSLKTKHPELEFKVFSGMEVYDQDNSPYQEVFDALRRLDGVEVIGNVSQEQLAEAFLESSILFYPCIFEETSCITAMEAMRGGAIPLTTKFSALPETIGEAGCLIDGLPGEGQYDKDFLLQAHRLLSDDDFYHGLQVRAIERGKSMSWKKRAESFDEFLKGL